MPKDVPVWDHFKRLPRYLQAFTIGVPTSMGRVYHQAVHNTYKNGDKFFDQAHNKYCGDYQNFCKLWNSVNGDQIPESAQIARLVMGYFGENPRGKVCVVRGVKKHKPGVDSPELVQLLSNSNKWVDVWSA